MSVSNRPPASSEYDDTLSLLDLVVVLVKYWRLIVGTTIIGGILINAYVFLTMYLPNTSPVNLLPNIYRAEATVLLEERAPSQLSQLNLSLSEVDSPVRQMIVRNSVQSSGGSVMLAEELLTGRTIYDRIIDEFEFFSRYGLVDRARTRARELVGKSLTSELHGDSSVLSIYYEEHNADFAAGVLTRVVQLLEERFRALTLEDVLLKKRNLTELVELARLERKKAQENLIAFQRTYGILEIADRPHETVQLLTDLNRELLSREVDLQSRYGSFSTNDPSVRQLQRETRILEQARDELRWGFRYFSARTIPQDRLPEIVANYSNMRNELAVYEDTYLRLRGQYELTRISETDPWATLQVIEPVETPDTHYWPDRGLMGLVGTVVVFCLAVMGAFFSEWMDRARTRPKDAAKLASISEELGRRNRHIGISDPRGVKSCPYGRN